MKIQPWTPEEDAFITTRWTAGATAMQIDEQMRGHFPVVRTYSAIMNRLMRLGYNRPEGQKYINRPRMADDRKADIIRRYQAGELVTEIAKDYGRSPTTMIQRLKDWGVHVYRYQRGQHASPEFVTLWNAGKTGSEIAAIMGVSMKAVEGWAMRGRKDGTIKPKSVIAPAWPPEDVALLKRLWDEGLGPRDISEQTGWSPNRIGGQRRKMGLPSRGYPAERKPAKGRDYAHLRAVAAEASRIAAERKAEARRLREEQAESLWHHTLTSRPFLEREKGECCWPLGESGDFHSCCDPVALGDTYCRKHRLIAGGRRVPMRERISPVTALSTKRGRPSVFDAGLMAA